MLKKEPDINVVAAFGDGESDLGSNKISGLKPDIVLLDLGLPSQNSLELVKSFDSFVSIRFIIFFLYPEDIMAIA